MDPKDLEGLDEKDKKEMLRIVEGMQTRDSLRMYNALVERCFSECVTGFRRKSLEQAEEKCVQKCVEKFLKHSARISLRFAELNAGAQEGAASAAAAAAAAQNAQPKQ